MGKYSSIAHRQLCAPAPEPHTVVGLLRVIEARDSELALLKLMVDKLKLQLPRRTRAEFGTWSAAQVRSTRSDTTARSSGRGCLAERQQLGQVAGCIAPSRSLTSAGRANSDCSGRLGRPIGSAARLA